MKSNSPFHFKQFSLNHRASPMAIGIDSMLLGAWCLPPSDGNILDIGTGCGLLAFMCAQKSPNASITGIDISKNAIDEAEGNRLQTTWHKRMCFIEQDLKSYQPPTPFDFIISNPPYFELDTNSAQSPDTERANARHQNQLSLEDLILFVNNHLTDTGKLALVLPYDLWNALTDLILKHNFIIKRVLFIQPTLDKPINRFLVEISKLNLEKNIVELKLEILVLRNANGGYTEKYIKLTKLFYLKELG